MCFSYLYPVIFMGCPFHSPVRIQDVEFNLEMFLWFDICLAETAPPLPTKTVSRTVIAWGSAFALFSFYAHSKNIGYGTFGKDSICDCHPSMSNGPSQPNPVFACPHATQFTNPSVHQDLPLSLQQSTEMSGEACYMLFHRIMYQ